FQAVFGRTRSVMAAGPVQSISRFRASEPIHTVGARSFGTGDDACWSGRSMPRSVGHLGFRTIRRSAWLIAIAFTIGCAHSNPGLRDRLTRRVVPTEVDAVRSTSPPEPKTSDRAAKDTRVRIAAYSQPGQGIEAHTQDDRAGPLPSAIEAPPRRLDSDQPSAPGTALRSASDEAPLAAIAASGKPLTLPDAIDLAFRTQPRLRAQVESIAQAQGQRQIVFSTFLPL